MSVIEFKELTLTDKQIFDKYFQLRRHESSHLNFTNIYMWRNAHQIQWAVDDDVLFIKSVTDDLPAIWQPLGTDENMSVALKNICNYFSERGEQFKFIRLEEFFVDVLKNSELNLEIERDETNFDYVYLAEDLINLSGRKYHTKKNHLHQFWKDYPRAQYLEINSDTVTECREQLIRWYEVRKDDNEQQDYLEFERDAIFEVLDNFDAFKLKGGALRLGGKIIAFSFGEQTNSDTAVIHVEKADPEIRGAYTAMNHEFVDNDWSDVTYINREEDMGMVGLRKAKESYHPVKLIYKYNAKFI